eukprot:508149-Amphidinium_carterae.2
MGVYLGERVWEGAVVGTASDSHFVGDHVLRGYIKSAYFEYTTSLFIMANTAYTTIVTDHMAQRALC